ncbi:PAS domain-containing protein (plasmid) [Devosia sp. A8/3-2]|nr:PAS domain-containing protein [Devosia sp. A8/3-2]
MSHSDQSSPQFHGDEPTAASTRAYFDRKELASVAFERTRMPMLMTDAQHPDLPIVFVNKAFLDLTGYQAQEVMGRNCRFLQGEGTLSAAVAEIRRGLSQQQEVNVELLNYRKDGSAFWNKLHISPIHDDDGKLIYHFASQIDVTEYRKVQSPEASEHRLLMEVDHRAKNVLAVVDGIVRLSKSDDAALYAAAVQQRVQALAAAHALMAERGWHEVSTEQVVKGQLRQFSSDRISLSGSEVMVSAIEIQPLALALHELIVNAAVHGALSDEGGQVAVNWTPKPQYGGFDLHWLETGTKVPEKREPGFGTIMVDAMIRQQLGGSIGRQWKEDGLTIHISLPGPLANPR